ncbi:MAG: hypothetical protein FK734_07945 [Asgard group archaeon]|nr:hypothetical protein [Asgard group archaeon]
MSGFTINVIKNPKDEVDQTCWNLIKNLNDLLKIGFEEDELAIQSRNEKLWLPGELFQKYPLKKCDSDIFWERFYFRLVCLASPIKFKNNRIDIDNFKKSYNEWTNKNKGYDLQSLDLIYFIDMFDLIELKKSEYDVFDKVEPATEALLKKEIIDVEKTLYESQKSILPFTVPTPLVTSEGHFYKAIFQAIYRITMCRDYKYLEMRRDVLDEIKFSELGRYGKFRARLQEESNKIAKALGRTEVNQFNLVEITVEFGLIIQALAEAKVRLKFVRGSDGKFARVNDEDDE